MEILIFLLKIMATLKYNDLKKVKTYVDHESVVLENVIINLNSKIDLKKSF